MICFKESHAHQSEICRKRKLRMRCYVPLIKAAWGLVFGWSKEYLGDAERRLSLVKPEMDDEWVDAAVEVRNISA